MLDERKVKIMTKLALYEETQGKEDFKVSEYYRKDYTAMHIVGTIIWTTIGYALLALLLVLGVVQGLMSSMSTTMIIMLGAGLVIGYLVVLIAFILITRHIHNQKHQDARQRVKKYNYDLSRLLKMYEKENR